MSLYNVSNRVTLVPQVVKNIVSIYFLCGCVTNMRTCNTLMSIISSTVLLAFSSSVVSAAQIHSSPLNIDSPANYKIKLRITFAKNDAWNTYPDIYTSRPIEIHDVNESPDGNGFGYKGAIVWNQSLPNIAQSQLDLVLPNLVIKQNVADPSIQLSGDIWDSDSVHSGGGADDRLCYFNSNVLIKKSDEGKDVNKAIVNVDSSNSCKAELISFEVL